MSQKLMEVGKLFEVTYKLISWSSIYGVNTPFQLLLYCSAGCSFCGLSRFAAFIVTAVVLARWGRHIINRGSLCLTFVCLSFGIDCWITCCSLWSRSSSCSHLHGREKGGGGGDIFPSLSKSTTSNYIMNTMFIQHQYGNICLYQHMNTYLSLDSNCEIRLIKILKG